MAKLVCFVEGLASFWCQSVLSVLGRLASFMASLFENAWFVRVLLFVKEIATTRCETMSCLWEECRLRLRIRKSSK